MGNTRVGSWVSELTEWSINEELTVVYFPDKPQARLSSNWLVL